MKARKIFQIYMWRLFTILPLVAILIIHTTAPTWQINIVLYGMLFVATFEFIDDIRELKDEK